MPVAQLPQDRHQQRPLRTEREEHQQLLDLQAGEHRRMLMHKQFLQPLDATGQQRRGSERDDARHGLVATLDFTQQRAEALDEAL